MPPLLFLAFIYSCVVFYGWRSEKCAQKPDALPIQMALVLFILHVFGVLCTSEHVS